MRHCTPPGPESKPPYGLKPTGAIQVSLARTRQTASLARLMMLR
jgi:hypothetical protein